MIFNKLLGFQELNLKKTKIRHAVRAVIFRNNKILLVQSNRGDYKFPGGGVEKNESFEEALNREIAEETGYLNSTVMGKIGGVIERRPDEYEPDTIFQMDSHYYYCELRNDEQTLKKLDGYEAEQEFTPKWVSLDEAISQNQLMLEQIEHNGWIRRENYVLNELIRKMKKDTDFR